jgi:hypothetical protein
MGFSTSASLRVNSTNISFGAIPEYLSMCVRKYCMVQNKSPDGDCANAIASSSFHGHAKTTNYEENGSHADYLLKLRRN